MRVNRSSCAFAITIIVVGWSLLTCTVATAQLQTGNLYGKVMDLGGNALPGATVTLDTGAARQVQVSNAQGEFRFLSLPPATMTLKAELDKFTTVEESTVVITVGHNTTVEIRMSPGAEDTVIVVAEPPPSLDSRQVSRGATVSLAEMQEVPTSRDPWTILSTTPGILVDRTNVAGSESGQQSVYVGPGSFAGNSIWSVDGVVITDMAALGASPSYYDFDAFQEMQVTTGGTDTTIATGGVVVNMVTKRGTNQWRGGARYFDTPGSTAANSNFTDFPAGQTHPSQTNHVVVVRDFGGELGGPIVKDRLWIWGSYGNQKITTVALGGVPNLAQLPTYNGKINAQLAASNSLTLFVLQNNKTVQGRDAGPSRPQETTWNQGHNGPNPTAAKAEDTQIFGPNFYLTALFSEVNGGFGLVPQGFGGYNPTAVSYQDNGAVFHNSFLDFQTLRPQKQGKLDASSFFNVGSISNELKYGASYRRVETDSLSTWGPGWVQNASLFNLPSGDNIFNASREENLKVRTTYASGYAQDTLAAGNLTANLGVRYDRQGGTNLPSSAPANAANPALLPAINYGGGPIGFSWGDFTPRLGLTYALGKDRKTLLRASYSRYADQLGAAFAGILNPTGTQTYYYFFTPQTGPGLPTTLIPLNYSGNVNPLTGLPFANRGNAVASNFSAPLTDEVLASIEHAVLPELVVGLNLTYRHLGNQVPSEGISGGAGELLVFDTANPFDPSIPVTSVGRPATAADYVLVTKPVTLPNGQASTISYHVLKPNVSTRGGVLLTNGNQTSDYKGASLTINKRLSNHWMMRGNFTYSNWTAGGDNGLADPTDYLPGGNRNGDAVLVQSAGSGPKTYVFINSKWAYNLNGMYQVMPDKPWGFNLAANVTGHQGYALPYYELVTYGSNYTGNLSSLVLADQPGSPGTPSRPDAQRLPSLNVFDARLEKEITFQDFGLTLGVDCFNLFNANTVLQRVGRIGLGSTNDVYEILSPRIYRFGARLSFR